MLQERTRRLEQSLQQLAEAPKSEPSHGQGHAAGTNILYVDSNVVWHVSGTSTATRRTVSDREKVERFHTVTKGMTKSQVFALLGPPDETEINTVRYVAYSGPHHGNSLKLWFSENTVTNVQMRHWLEAKPPDL